MPKTLLAVDDSATMRKVLEITFGGEDFRVVSADGAAGALAKEVRSRNARAAILLMTSRYNPFDANRARDAGIDDSVDKPFDTQALIDKVKKAMLARETARAAAPAPPPAPPPAPAPAPPQPQAMNATAPLGGAPRPPAAPPSSPQSAPSTVSGPKGWPTQRTHTLSFEGGPPVAPPPAISAPTPLARTAQSGPVAPPVTAPAPPPPPAPVAHAAHPTAVPSAPTAAPRAIEPAPVTAAVSTNGHLAGKLDELGLTPQQVEAVLALSRDLVERVVWEVVPALAEALIKEEIVRLTKEG